MSDEGEIPDDPVSEIPDPDTWRIRDLDNEYREQQFVYEERYQTNYAYIQAVHTKRMADAMERMAAYLSHVAFHFQQANREGDDP